MFRPAVFVCKNHSWSLQLFLSCRASNLPFEKLCSCCLLSVLIAGLVPSCKCCSLTLMPVFHGGHLSPESLNFLNSHPNCLGSHWLSRNDENEYTKKDVNIHMVFPPWTITPTYLKVRTGGPIIADSFLIYNQQVFFLSIFHPADGCLSFWKNSLLLWFVE